MTEPESTTKSTITIPEVRIELPTFGDNGRVWIGDVEITKHVCAVNARAVVGEATQIILTLAPRHLLVRAQGQPQMDVATRGVLIALGWTPPREPIKVEPTYKSEPAIATNSILCKRCDIWVGFGAAGIFVAPTNKSYDWLTGHCWSCGRSRADVIADPRGDKDQEPPR